MATLGRCMVGRHHVLHHGHLSAVGGVVDLGARGCRRSVRLADGGGLGEGLEGRFWTLTSRWISEQRPW